MRGLSETAIAVLLERPDLVAELACYEAARAAGDKDLAGHAAAALVVGLAGPGHRRPGAPAQPIGGPPRPRRRACAGGR